MEGRTYLNVPFADKDAVKAVGGYWDSKQRQRYVMNSNPRVQELVQRY